MALRVEHELHRRRLGRNLGVGLVLVALVAIVFGLTVVKVVNLGEAGAFQNLDRATPAAPGGAPGGASAADTPTEGPD